MHKDISVAVPTRHRSEVISKFVETLDKNTNDGIAGVNRPHLTILYDAPEPPKLSRPVYEYKHSLQEITLFDKHGLCGLYNKAIIHSPTDWVMLCNDDIEFRPGWLEYVEEQIATNKYDMICLFSYGAVVFHKSLICKVGWFDERVHGGGYEDNDYQLRMYEAGLKDRVDRSHDFTHKEGKTEVGHFVKHTKHEYSQSNNWAGCNNADWIQEKWSNNLNWKKPAYRAKTEIDWHPRYTERYCKKYNIECSWPTTTGTSIMHKMEVFHG